MFNRAGTSGFGLDFAYVGQTTQNTTLSTYTFSSHDLGKEHPERMIVIAISLGGSTPVAVTTSTVAGNASTFATGGGAGNVRQVIRYIKLPTGTSGDIVVNVTGTCISCRVTVYRFNTAATSPLDAVTDNPTSSTTATAADIECSSGGVVIGDAVSDINQTITPSWNGSDSLETVYSNGGTSIYRWGGYVLSSENSTTNDLSISVTSSDSLVVSAASFEFTKG